VFARTLSPTNTLIYAAKRVWSSLVGPFGQIINRGEIGYFREWRSAGTRHFARRRSAKWIWRCHIESSAADMQVVDFLAPYIDGYDALVFTMPAFLLPRLDPARAGFVAPAIDPFATRNIDLPIELCRHTILDSGIDVERPLLLQV